MINLKKTLKDKPAYKDIFLQLENGEIKALKEIGDNSKIKLSLLTKDSIECAKRFYNEEYKKNPNRRIVSFKLSKPLSIKDIIDHLEKQTDIGKEIAKDYQELVKFVLKRIGINND